MLAIRFLYYTFDEWMKWHYPGVRFERYADDIIFHCDSRAQAQELREQLELRLGQYGLQLHPETTKIVYCADENRKQGAAKARFDFLGFTFKPRSAKGPRGVFTTFSPAVSDMALKAIREKVRGWHLGSRVSQSSEQVQADIGPTVRG